MINSNKNSTQYKEIPHFYQLLNFLFSDVCHKYNFLPIDKLLIIALAKHCGKQGIFPSQETLANELQISVRFVRSRIKILEEMNILSTNRMSRKTNYVIHIPELQFRYGAVIPELQFRSYRNYSSGHTGTVVPTNNQLIDKINNKEPFIDLKKEEERKRKGQRSSSEILQSLGIKSKSN